jgi:methanogenic corrinoid protein MtbC1
VSHEAILIVETLESLELSLPAHDREAAVRAVLAAVDKGLAIEELYSHVLSPFLASVGRGWQEGRTAVWEEHLIVGAVRAAIEALYPRVLGRKSQVEPVPITVVFFCPPEETHDVGLRMLADRFDLRGFRTIYIGAGTPVHQMIECVRTVGARVICLSASTHFQKTALHNVIGELRGALPDVRIVAGGPAFAAGVAAGADWQEYVVDSVDELLDELTAVASTNGSAAAEQTAAASQDRLPEAGGAAVSEGGPQEDPPDA